MVRKGKESGQDEEEDTCAMAADDGDGDTYMTTSMNINPKNVWVPCMTALEVSFERMNGGVCLGVTPDTEKAGDVDRCRGGNVGSIERAEGSVFEFDGKAGDDLGSGEGEDVVEEAEVGSWFFCVLSWFERVICALLEHRSHDQHSRLQIYVHVHRDTK
jgi:hypothetical protein